VQEPYDWTVLFERRVRELLLAEQYRLLTDYESQPGSEADLALPTLDAPALCGMQAHGRRTPYGPSRGSRRGIGSMLTVLVI